MHKLPLDISVVSKLAQSSNRIQSVSSQCPKTGLDRCFGPCTGRCRLAIVMATRVFQFSQREVLLPVQGAGRPEFD